MSNERVLIIEDTLTQAKILQHILLPAGYEVQIVRFPTGAAETSRQFKPDAILCDITMPELNGYQVCEQFKSDAELRSIPFILLSGLSDIRELKNIVSCGADGFIFKSFDPKFFLPQFQSIVAQVQTTGGSDKQLSEISVDGIPLSLPASRLLNMLLATYQTAIFQQQKTASATLA